MSKIVKIILGLFLVILVVVIGGLLVAYFKRNAVVKVALEKILTDQMQVPVTVEKVDLRLISQSLQLSGLSIANPEGYKSKEAIHIDDIYVKLDVASFRTNEPHINNIRITKPKVTLEYIGLKTNLGKIMDNLDKKEAEVEAPVETAQAEDAPAESKKYVIDSMEIIKTKSSVIVPATAHPVSVTMPDLKIDNLGGENQTWTIAKGLKFFLTQLVMGTLKYGTDLPGELISAVGDGFSASAKEFQKYGGAAADGLKKMGSSVSKGVSDAVDKTTDAVEGGTKAVKDSTKGLTDGVKGLLGGKKKKEE